MRCTKDDKMSLFVHHEDLDGADETHFDGIPVVA
jgi:hypothetical protein